MKILINIPEERFADIQRIASVQSERRVPSAEQIIANGTPLSREPEQEWIPCSERMPKKTGYYICTCHDGTYYRTSVLKWSTGWTLTGARSYWKVIAWMPLPEPYAERRQDALN